MRKELSILVATIIILGCFSRISSQDRPVDAESSNENVAPISWKRYLVPEQKLSFRMPKLPRVTRVDDPCEEKTGAIYQAYAAEVIYEFAWYEKSSSSIPEQCGTRKAFGPFDYLQRLAELRKQNNESETSTKIGGLSATVFKLETPQYIRSRWLMWSIDQWVEMTITRRPGIKLDEEEIVGSIKFSSMDGIDVCAGSSQIIGDFKMDLTKNTKLASAELVMISKPRPGYTEAARTNSVRGNVILKVTFLANGSIGPISVEKPLEHGLTDQSIAAVRRILFLPKTENGVPVDLVRNVEYHFSIY